MRALIILALLLASAGAPGPVLGVTFGPTGPAPLPEPGTLTLIAAGALAAFKLRRKK
jgi:hypothetical protein